MKLENIGCLKCGGVLVKKSDNVYLCEDCGRSFSKKAIENATEKMLREILLQRIAERNAQKIASDGDFYPTLNDYDVSEFQIDNGVLTEHKKYRKEGEIRIPKGVTAIDNLAFSYSCMSNVVIPDSVVSIGDTAFSECNNITHLQLPQGLASVGKNAFRECSKLEEVIIPDSVTDIGQGAFSQCLKLVSIIVDKNNPRYKSDGNCLIDKSTKTLILGSSDGVIPDDGSVKVIGDNAFAYCNIQSAVIPDSVIEIGYNAFANCKNLTDVILGRNLTVINRESFSCCCNLTDITVLSKHLSLVDECTFYNCGSLKKVAVPTTISTLKRSVFNSTGLTDIMIPRNVTVIEDGVFFNCAELRSAQIPASVRSIGHAVFSGCVNLSQIKYDGTIAQWRSIKFSKHGWYYDIPAKYVICRDGKIPI